MMMFKLKTFLQGIKKLIRKKLYMYGMKELL